MGVSRAVKESGRAEAEVLKSKKGRAQTFLVHQSLQKVTLSTTLFWLLQDLSEMNLPKSSQKGSRMSFASTSLIGLDVKRRMELFLCWWRLYFRYWKTWEACCSHATATAQPAHHAFNLHPTYLCSRSLDSVGHSEHRSENYYQCFPAQQSPAQSNLS